MQRLAELSRKIEVVRLELHEIAKAKNYYFLDEEVKAVSERLDELVLEFQKLKVKLRQ